ncbi:MAG: PQQ-dependent sugar dehydrogenase [Bacteroidetes bacterium]|nr:PQQ-dependent sugar dehydrogenase [Bacteroidota bacterium]
MLTTSCKKTKIYPNLIPFATGIEQPVSIANAGDSRLFVVGQLGSVYIVDSSGNVMDSPFLDIHERVVYGGERGLLGLAFHPNYRQNGYFFVNYIGENDSTHISRFSVSRDNPNHADPSSEVKLLTLKQPFENHNGGNLIFGPDGDLYIGLGDGGSAGDPGNRAQNLMEYFGKMLRINVDSGNSYRIPASNPFVHSLNARGEIWALGLRNPWRFSFDRLTGDLWIADVGQNEIEEIDCQPASSKGGENYGWRIYEGNKSYKPEKAKEGSNFVFPVYTYPHGPECSITGGFVYRGSDKSPYYGHYFFADYCSDKIWTLYKQNGVWASEEFGHYDGNHFSTFGEDSKGRLYVAGLTTGTIYRINDLPTGPGK